MTINWQIAYRSKKSRCEQWYLGQQTESVVQLTLTCWLQNNVVRSECKPYNYLQGHSNGRILDRSRKFRPASLKLMSASSVSHANPVLWYNTVSVIKYSSGRSSWNGVLCPSQDVKQDSLITGTYWYLKALTIRSSEIRMLSLFCCYFSGVAERRFHHLRVWPFVTKAVHLWIEEATLSQRHLFFV